MTAQRQVISASFCATYPHDSLYPTSPDRPAPVSQKTDGITAVKDNWVDVSFNTIEKYVHVSRHSQKPPCLAYSPMRWTRPMLKQHSILPIRYSLQCSRASHCFLSTREISSHPRGVDATHVYLKHWLYLTRVCTLQGV